MEAAITNKQQQNRHLRKKRGVLNDVLSQILLFLEHKLDDCKTRNDTKNYVAKQGPNK